MVKQLLQAENLTKHFYLEKGFFSRIFSKQREIVHAVDNVSFSITEGETFTLIGETGCGKTTLGKLVLRLTEPTDGKIFFKGQDILALDDKKMRKLREDMQIIFQDPYASLNPRRTVREILSLPLSIHTEATEEEKTERVIGLLEAVGLTPAERMIGRHPHEFSGGQRQRLVIARALALRPSFVVADEPVASLDMSIRSQIINLMQDLKEEYNLTYLLIAHDLPIVRYMSTKVATMYLGKIVELGPCQDFFSSPMHPYTMALIAAEPSLDPTVKKRRVKLIGEMPSPIDPPKGCRFHTRCPFMKEVCKISEPELVEVEKGHYTACHRGYL